MTDDKILSEDEIETMLNAAKSSAGSQDGLSLVPIDDDNPETNYQIKVNNFSNTIALSLTRQLGDFLRKKVLVTVKNISAMKIKNDGISNKNGIFVLFTISPRTENFLLFVSSELLYQIMNSLYGGRVDAQDLPNKPPSKLSMMVFPKISQILLSSFHEAMPNAERMKLNQLKSDTYIDISSVFAKSNAVSYIEYNLNIDNVNMEFIFIVPDKFLLVTEINKDKNKAGSEVVVRERNFWRDAIKTEVIDSSTSLSISLPEIKMPLNDFMKMKVNDLIPIPNPNYAYVCLNNIKLFNSAIGKGTNKLVAKILNQI